MNTEHLGSIKPRLQKCEGDIQAGNKRAEKHASRMDIHQSELSKLLNTKVEKADDVANRREIASQMKAINSSHDTLRDQQIALESYVEKYLPLRM